MKKGEIKLHGLVKPILKGVFITTLILLLSFSFAFAVFIVKRHQEFLAKKEAFLQSGIDVVYEDKRVMIAPIDPSTFADVAGTNLALPAQEPQSAHVEFKRGRYQIVPEIIGLKLNEEKLFEDLAGRIKTFSHIPIIAEISQVQPEILTKNLTANLPELKKKFEQIVTLTSPEYSTIIRLRDHLDWIRLAAIDDKITFTIDPDAFSAFAQQNLTAKINTQATSVAISRNTKNEIIFSDKAKNGARLNAEELYTLYSKALNEGMKKIEFPIIEEKFTLDISPDLQALGIKEVVSIGHTSYYGSPQNRMHNIRIGLKKFNGIMIAPGETFSFVKELGPVDGSRGFLKELVIKPEGTLPDFGGGLCQVSTTAYRAALYAGLPVIERSPHSYAVSYYSQIGGHGIDATIYPGARDLRFTNDTPGSLLIQAYDDGPEAYFILYGTNDGREVKLDGPVISNRHSEKGTTYIKTTEVPLGTTRQTKHAQAGFDTLWYRYLTLPGGISLKEEIKSRYVSTKDEFLVGVSKEDVFNKEISAEELYKKKVVGIKN